jgi:hypothetical protein
MAAYQDFDELFNSVCPWVQFDENRYNLLKGFRLSWAQKSDDYIEFLGNNLTGVYPIRFSQQDEDLLYELYGLNQKEFQSEIYKVKGVDKNMRTISNSTFILLLYTAHKFTISKSLPEKIKEDAVRECYYIFIYKVISSRTAYYFKYNIDVSIAKAINERMTNKYLIKRFNSWQEVFEYKALDILSKGIHYQRMKNFDVNDSGRIISDLYTKMNDIFKNNYAVFMEVKDANDRIYSSSLIKQGEDGEKIGDITNRSDTYSTYIKTIISNQVDFINLELLELVVSTLKNISLNDTNELLQEISKINHIELDPYIDKIFVASIEYLIRKKLNKDFIKNLYIIISTLGAYWKSSNFKQKECKEVKKYFFEFTKKNIKRKNKTIIVNSTIAIIIYIALRGLYGKGK